MGELRYEELGHVGVVTLDRPEARNALTFATYAALEEAVRSTTARCLVITGTDPAFCSGDDVKQVMAKAGDAVASGLASEPRLTPAADALLHTDVPVIAEEIAASPPLAVQRLKQGLRVALDPDWAALGRWVSESLAELFRTDDHREGVAAFLEKREPRHEGR